MNGALKSSACVSLAAILAVFMSEVAVAKTLGLNCTIPDVDGGVAIALNFAGEDTGELTAESKLGSMKLPATTRQPAYAAASPESILLEAWGPAAVLLPTLSAIEDCVMGKLSAENLNDADMKEVTAVNCIRALPLSTVPIAVDAAFEIMIDETGAGGTYSLKYPASTKLGANAVRISFYPLRDCKVIP